MGIYIENGPSAGFVNWDYIYSKKMPFMFVIGGRGIGKTYGKLAHGIDTDEKIMLIRRTQKQVDIVTSMQYNPYKAINRDRGYTDPFLAYHSDGDGITGLYWTSWVEDRKGPVRTGELMGYAAALSTFKNLRGISGEDVDTLLFDEFLPEDSERVNRFEGNAFINAYETLARNRELVGKPPLKAVLMSNANSLASPVLLEFSIIGDITKMVRKGQTERLIKDRGIGIWLLRDSPISEAKRNTALYKAVSSDYGAMALDNQFSASFSQNVASRPLKEYKPLVAVGELVIYEHKSEPLYYCSTHMSGQPTRLACSKDGILLFQRNFGFLRFATILNRVEFETEACRILFDRLW